MNYADGTLAHIFVNGTLGWLLSVTIRLPRVALKGECYVTYAEVSVTCYDLVLLAEFGRQRAPNVGNGLLLSIHTGSERHPKTRVFMYLGIETQIRKPKARSINGLVCKYINTASIRKYQNT